MKNYSLHQVVPVKDRAVAAAAVKICGLKDAIGLRAAVELGASFLGLNFVEGSSRQISPALAEKLVCALPQPALCRLQHYNRDVALDGSALILTALFADANDALRDEVVAMLGPCLGLIQLHGNETPERVAEIKARTGVPVMKAIALATADDLEAIGDFEKVVDLFLFDAKINGKSGGTGKVFDWSLLKKVKTKTPWMLAGGLTPDNVAQAIAATGAKIVDVSSGVETKGQKDIQKIRAFIRASAMDQ
ncbi:MAG: phosphoribosylanthranilate isomerase [Proteobacteria bacterium]|nr:phosphoribosylanthranilate isomerase [Pseudomonadota bacterium]